MNCERRIPTFAFSPVNAMQSDILKGREYFLILKRSSIKLLIILLDRVF